MALETHRWEGDLPGALVIIDQRQLPVELTHLHLDTVQATWDAIDIDRVRTACFVQHQRMRIIER